MSQVAVPADHAATVVTHLAMDQPPRLSEPGAAGALVLRRWADPSPDEYRDLFARVGSRWLWYSRLLMDDAKLRAILSDPATQVHRVFAGQKVVGFVELSFAEQATALISFLGLVPELAGRGHGRCLLEATLALAWAGPGVRQVGVTTCTLDHPAALPNYIRGGFRVTGRSLETFPDPRLLGVLPPDCAPQVPLLGTPGATTRWA